jgi:hypothetical protein
MEESQSNQDHPKSGAAFVDKVSGAVQRSAGDMELHQGSNGSLAARGYLNDRPVVPSEFAMHDTSVVGSNQHFQGYSHGGNLYDEQSLVSAFEDMTFRTRAADSPTDCCIAALTNGHYPSGREDVVLNQQRVSATHQDDYVPLQFSASYAHQRTDELASEDRQHAYGFPPQPGIFSRSSRQPNRGSNFSIPYQPSTASASPFQQNCYFDGRSPMYTSYDEPVGSNFIPRQDMDVQAYSVMHPHYAYPQMQQVSGLDVARNRRINRQASVFSPANGASSYLGIPNVHGLESGNPYLNGATIQKSNGRLNSTFEDRPTSTAYIRGSCGSGVFHQFWQQEKAACPYGPGFSQHRITGNSTISYPERILMRPDSMNSVRYIKFSPSANGYADMDQRINGFEYNHQRINDSVNLEWLNHQFLSFKYVSDSAMASPQRTYNSVNEIVGRICTVAKDQNGCRFLQKVFTEGTQQDAEKVFAEMIDHIGELMVDPFAYYLVQKILEDCDDDHRMRIICEITKVPVDLLKICCNMHGYELLYGIFIL